MLTYSHLLVEGHSKRSSHIKPYADSHDVLDTIEGFSHLSYNYNSFPPVKIKTKPMMFILRRKDWRSKVIRGNIKNFSDSTKKLPLRKTAHR